MNRDRILAVADRIERAGDAAFFMPKFFAQTNSEGFLYSAASQDAIPALNANKCGTAGCFAGHALAEAALTTPEEYEALHAEASVNAKMFSETSGPEAAAWLGLEDYEADWLFLGYGVAKFLTSEDGDEVTADDVMMGFAKPTAVEGAKLLRQFADGEIGPDEDYIETYRFLHGIRD